MGYLLKWRWECFGKWKTMDELGSFRGCFEFFFLGNLKEKYSGPYNLVAPENITNKQFHQLLSEKTPSIKILSTPSFILKMTLGTRSSLLLKSPNVRSKKLSKVDFHFKFPNISSTLKDLLHERKVISAHYLSIKQWVPVPLDKVWTFFSSIHNLEKITPPWLSFKIKTDFSQEIDKGTRILYSLKIHGIPFSWQSKISNWNPREIFQTSKKKAPINIGHIP